MKAVRLISVSLALAVFLGALLIAPASAEAVQCNLVCSASCEGGGWCLWYFDEDFCMHGCHECSIGYCWGQSSPEAGCALFCDLMY